MGALTLVYAFRYGKAIVVSPLTNAGAPLITALLALALLGLVPQPLKIIGIVLAFIAAALLAIEPEEAPREGASRAGAPPPGRRGRRNLLRLLGASVWRCAPRSSMRAPRGGYALIEATSNQVNQEGGYTGLRPAQFRDLVLGMADQSGLPRERVLLGGDHLGPNAWQSLPADEALGARGRHGERVRARGLPQDPSRLLDVLRRTTRGCCRMTSWRRAPPRCAHTPKRPGAAAAANRLFTSSAPKCRCPAARRRP